MSANERRTVLLASPRSTYLVGPVSGLQLVALLAGVVLPIFIALSGIPGWGFLVLLVLEIAVICAVRKDGANGWRLLGRLWRNVRRARPSAVNYAAPSEPALWHSPALPVEAAIGNTRRLFAAAPGRLAPATVLSTPSGDVFLLPRPGGQTKPGRATAAWHVSGPGTALLPGHDQDLAIDAWAAGINRLAALPGLVGLSIHVRANTAAGLREARMWHDQHSDAAAVPVAASSYQELLEEVQARQATCTLAVTFEPRRAPGRLAGIPALVDEVPGILRDAGLELHGRVNAQDVVDAALDVAGCEPGAPAAQIASMPVFPLYRESMDLVEFDGICHTALAATTATAVGVDGTVLAPLFTTRAGVEIAVALTIRPLPTEQTQARARARQVKLRRLRAAADSSSMSGLLIDTHRLDQEMATLHALGADAARGSVETELVITASINGNDPERVRAAGAALVRDAAPLRFTCLPYPAPAVLFTNVPIGGLL